MPPSNPQPRPEEIIMTASDLALQAADIADRARALAQTAAHLTAAAGPVAEAVEPFIFLLAIFLMACFVGYYVVWNVTPALHSPLMGVTNAISSVIIVGAMLATGLATSPWAMAFGFIGVTLASVNIFGGFVVTQRMLSMFKKRK
jgi:NAD(P) transhydrogenase subunit alpha